ncbi:MAG: ABC transporter permease [Chloroflexi bacterium]|nr:ABC transporter permease [Chloroflexota bacterium]
MAMNKDLMTNFPLSARRGRALAPGAFALALGVFLWYALIWLGGVQPFILPAPHQVWGRFLRALADGSLAGHSWVTLQEVLAGLALGAAAAMLFGYALAKSTVLEKFLAPYVVASQAVPTVAIAPLLVIWFGPGLASKVLVCALIVFFPILINTVVGVRSVPEDLRDLMRSLHASRAQTFRLLELPAALPVLLGGFRIGATLAVIGAVVGEFVGADRGLGYLLSVARGQYDVALVFVAVFTLIAMALSLYGLVALAERATLGWQRQAEQSRMTFNPTEKN